MLTPYSLAKHMTVQVYIVQADRTTSALLDCRSMGNFIHEDLVHELCNNLAPFRSISPPRVTGLPLSFFALFPGLCPRSFVDITFVLCFVTSFVPCSLCSLVTCRPCLCSSPASGHVHDCIGSFVPSAAPSRSVHGGSIYDYITSYLDEQ